VVAWGTIVECEAGFPEPVKSFETRGLRI